MLRLSVLPSSLIPENFTTAQTNPVGLAWQFSFLQDELLSKARLCETMLY